jgi:hypothetical protein
VADCDPEETCTGSAAECPPDMNACFALLPFEENFDSGSMSEFFETSSSNTGRIQITDLNSPLGGSGYHLTMDSSVNGTYSRNELILYAELAGVQAPYHAILEFFHKEFMDEDNSMPASFSGSSDSDGVAISVDDGQTWYKVQGLISTDGISGQYQNYQVDLTQAAGDLGISLASPTLIKFQQYDNYGITTDGFAFDQIELYEHDPNQPPPAAQLPFSEDFESGQLDEWWTLNTTEYGRTQITSSWSPHQGSNHLTMDSRRNGTNSLNELILLVDLAGHTGVTLEFWQKEFSDEDHVMPDEFDGSVNADGVAISIDGSHWYKVQGLVYADGSSGTWKLYSVNLSDIAATYGITLGAQTWIKFQQYDNYGISTDGHAFDDITITD